NYGGAKPAQTAQIAFAVGAHYAEQQNWDKAKGALTGSMSVIDKAAPDVQAQAHATLGHVYQAGYKATGMPLARAEYAKVRSIWANPGDAQAKINAAYPSEDEGQKNRRLAKALNAVGEA